MHASITTVLLLTAVLTVFFSVSARAQSLLEDASVFASVAGLNTVPDHGDGLVSFLDYRDAGYSIMAVDVATKTEHQLERIFYAEPVVSTFGQRVTWIGYTPIGQPDVYLHDRAEGTTVRITSDADFQNHPDLSESILVWQDYRNAASDGMNADIYMYDFVSQTTTPVTTDPGYQDLPRVHGNWVVWQDYRHADSLLKTADIYAYDLLNGTERRLTSGTFYRTHPAVWEELVVWEDYRNGENGDIYLYDTSSNREMSITTDDAHQSHPSVYGDWVLWIDYRHSAEQGDLYGYNVKTQEEYALVVHPAHQEAPHVYENHVVWQDYRDGRFDLFGGTLSAPASTTAENVGKRHGLRLSAAPNPFVDSVTFYLTDALLAPLELTIYNAIGRTVYRREIAAGQTTVSWDGRVDSGDSLAAGVYIAVARGQDMLRQTVLVRHK